MKAICILFIFIFTFHNAIRGQSFSNENIDQLCKAFVAMTDTALKQKQFEKVAIYSNAFRLLKEQFAVEEKYTKYFREVNLNNFKLIGDWVISLNTIPKKPRGFVNIESLSKEQIETLEQDIKRIKSTKKIE